LGGRDPCGVDAYEFVHCEHEGAWLAAVLGRHAAAAETDDQSTTWRDQVRSQKFNNE